MGCPETKRKIRKETRPLELNFSINLSFTGINIRCFVQKTISRFLKTNPSPRVLENGIKKILTKSFGILVII